MLHHTTIQINDLDTEVTVEFHNQFGEIKIGLMTDVLTGDAIAPDLLDEFHSMLLYAELHMVSAHNEADRLDVLKEEDRGPWYI